MYVVQLFNCSLTFPRMLCSSHFHPRGTHILCYLHQMHREIRSTGIRAVFSVARKHDAANSPRICLKSVRARSIVCIFSFTRSPCLCTRSLLLFEAFRDLIASVISASNLRSFVVAARTCRGRFGGVGWPLVSFLTALTCFLNLLQ